MNLYSLKPDAFDDDDINNGEALAAHVGVALAASQNVENLELAISNRTVIGRAEGILMERFGIPPTRRSPYSVGSPSGATSSSTTWPPSWSAPGRRRGSG